MKKFYIMIVSWLVFIAAVFVGSVLYERFKTSSYDDLAIPYLQQSLPIISTWDAQQIRQLMAPVALAKIPDQQFQETINVFSRLGRLGKLEQPRFSKIHAEAGVDNSPQTIVEYTADAEYASGKAEIVISLLQTGNSFKVYHFNLGSQALLQ